jgi:hypothetical protein
VLKESGFRVFQGSLFSFFVGGRKFLLSMARRQKKSLNGDAMVFDSIETLVSFSSVWYVCVVVGCRMIMWQGSYQVKCIRRKSRGAMTEGCVTMHISNVVFGFQLQGGCGRLVFLDLYFE